jgi:hypothetical protein
MAGKLAFSLLACALVVIGRAGHADDDPIGKAYTKCIFDEAIKQGRTNKSASPDGVDAPGGPCEAEGKAQLAELKAQHPDYTDKELTDMMTDARNAVWRYTINQLGN